MWLLWLLSWAAYAFYAAAFLFCFAVGLYYLAELVEEYTVLTGKVIRWLIVATLLLHGAFLLLEEGAWWSLVAVGALAHLFYASLLRGYPGFRLTSPGFIASTLLLLAHHYLAFAYFADAFHPFLEVLGFFTFLVWPTPFLLVISLSANELTLPQTTEPMMRSPERTHLMAAGSQQRHQQQQSVLYSDAGSGGGGGYGGHFVNSYLKGKRRGLLYFFNNLRDSVSPAGWKSKKGY